MANSIELTTLSQQVVTWNNNGVWLLSRGNHKEALSVYYKGLKSMKRILELVSASSQRQHQETPLSHEEQRHTISSVPISERGDFERDSTVIAGCTFFNRAFTTRCPVSSECQNRLAAIICYNTALVHHDKGIRRGTSKELEYALKYYDMALSIVRYIAEERGLQGMLLPLLAIYNNMGNIHTHFFNFTRAQLCSQRMRLLVDTNESSELDEDDFAFFSMNLLIAPHCENVSVAPAA